MSQSTQQQERRWQDTKSWWHCARVLLGLWLTLWAANAALASAQFKDACSQLQASVPSASDGALFIPSFPSVQGGPLHRAAFLYDNAVALIALVGCNEVPTARRLGDAILLALAHDRYWHDGRLRSGYAAGPVDDGPIKLAGWWDDAQNRWLEDRYQVGSDTGNMAWALLALLALDGADVDPRYRAGAIQIGTYILSAKDARGSGGFTGGHFGHEPDPEPLTWKSTEHNTDLTAAFTLLAKRTQDSRWRIAADDARRFVAAMWDPACQCFATGTGTDGITRNPLVALDAQIWPLLALPGAAHSYEGVLDSAHQRLGVEQGFAYSDVRQGIWTEGTAQMLLLQKLLGHDKQALVLRNVIEAQREPHGGYYASNSKQLPTGFMLATDPSQPRVYFHVPHLAPLAWAALAERRFNPFTDTTGLPRPPQKP